MLLALILTDVLLPAFAMAHGIARSGKIGSSTNVLARRSLLVGFLSREFIGKLLQLNDQLMSTGSRQDFTAAGFLYG